MRHTIIPATYLILVQKNNVLLSKRGKNLKYEPSMWALPSGHVEFGEDAKVALVREVKEETNITILEEDLVLEKVLYRNLNTEKDNKEEKDRVDFFFSCEKFSEEIQNNEPEKCEELCWFELGYLPENIVLCVREVLEEYKEKSKEIYKKITY